MQPWEKENTTNNVRINIKKKTKRAVRGFVFSFLACSMIYGTVLHNVSKDILKSRKYKF